MARMRDYARVGYAFDLEENEDHVRCLAAPVRDVAGTIVAAISVSSAAQYMSDERMRSLTRDVVGTARRISRDLGWAGQPTAGAPRSRAFGKVGAAANKPTSRRAKRRVGKK
jgi:hypothetical protein